MLRFDEMVWCDGCGVEMTWGPVVLGKLKYCCQDCAEGLKCECGARMDVEEEVRSSRSSPVDVPGISSD